MSDVDLFRELQDELVDVSIPAKKVQILAAGAAGKDEPAALVWVDAVSPEQFEELNKPLTDAARKVATESRRNGRNTASLDDEEVKTLTQERTVAWARTLIAESSGFTMGNVNFLLAPAKKAWKIDFEGSPTLAAIFEEVDGRREVDLGKHPAFAAILLTKADKDDFDALISSTARTAAQEYAAEMAKKGNA